MTGLVQYVLVRSDLKTWPLGAVIAQACHGCTAVIYQYRNDENVVKYTEDLDNMHKCVLEVQSEEQLRDLSEKLKDSDIHHKLWIEQPENCATCIAVKPYPKNEVKKFFNKFKLMK